MTQDEKQGHEVIAFPRMRHIVVDFLSVAHAKHTMHGLFEVDVTRARRLLREHKARSGESLSFTAFFITCLARAVEENRAVHAYRDWRNRLVLFDDVDVATIFEVPQAQMTFPLTHVLRAANRREYLDIHREIRAIQARPDSSAGLEQWRFMRWFLFLPAFVRRAAYRLLLRRPHLLKQYMGTVIVTAVGMFARGSGWGISPPVYSVGAAVGSIAERPVLDDGHLENREYLSLTLSFDHDVVDGAPAARFARRLQELLESTYGLEGLEQESPQDGKP